MSRLRPFVGLVGDVARTYQLRRVSRSAAEFAYFLTLSIFPLLICALVIIAGFENIDLSIENMFGDVWAGDILETIQDYLVHVNSYSNGQILVPAILVLATSSSAAFRSVAKIMTDIQGSPRFRGPLNMVISFGFSLLLVATIYISVFIFATGGWLMEMVEEWTGIRNLAMVWQWLRFVILFVILVVVIHMMYVFTAPKAQGRRLPGAILATVALVAGSMIFSMIMGASARYPLIYGSLATFILLMVWCYLCGNIIIIGNVINHALYKRKMHSFGGGEPLLDS